MYKSREMNLCSGPIFKQLVLYALPLMATNFLQLLFNATDVAVVGIFASNGDNAVGAISATGIVVSLVTCLFIGLSVGANVLVARFVGEKNETKARRVVGTSVLFSVVAGVFLSLCGVLLAKTILRWTNCSPVLIDKATKYLQIYFLGMPMVMLYNFSASILRAVGDTLHPFIFLVIGGVVNIGLNIFFVTVFHMDVEGVAIATIVSQTISAVLCVWTMHKGKGYARLQGKYLRFYKRELIEMIKIGFPAGLQSATFAISNLLIQSTINSFGNLATTANGVAATFDGFIYNGMNAVSLSALAFVSQNLGAGKIDRVKKSVNVSIFLVAFVGLVMGLFIVLLHKPLCGIITSDPEVIAMASRRMIIIGLFYFTFGVMEVWTSAIRGLGRSLLAMSVTLSCCCVFRVVWLKTVYLLAPTLNNVYWVYAISWVLGMVLAGCFYFSTVKRVQKRMENPSENGNEFAHLDL